MTQRLSLFVLILLLGGCSGGGAVAFAPTPPPPDTSPLTYNHPSGAFAVAVPQQWAARPLNAETLATVAFTPEGEHAPALTFAVVRLPETPATASAVRALLDAYQTSIRPDAARYREANREAMPDGSWRMTGLRVAANGETQALNTFIEIDGPMVGIAEAVLPDDEATRDDIEAALNSFVLREALTPSGLETLGAAVSGRLEAVNIHTWQTADGVFFVTGEVANYSDRPLTEIPVMVTLRTADGRAVAEADDLVMGHGVGPGGFAPFSLRFGSGQPPLTERYTLVLGGDGWTPAPDTALYGAEVLSWTEAGTLTEDGRLVVVGEVTNTSVETLAYLPRAVVTAFDADGNVVGAAFSELDDVELTPGERAPFEIVIPALDGDPTRYIVGVQAVP